MAGSALLTATVTPAATPPPPTGMAIVRTCGHCCRISRPRVPWPATMSGWSNGWMSTADRSLAYSRAYSTASSTVSPWKMMSAP